MPKVTPCLGTLRRSFCRNCAKVTLHAVTVGEELMIILPQCGLPMAAQKAERLRAAIASLSDPKGAQVTASFGVAALPATSQTTRDMMAAADAALYEAKQNGRNRVVCAPAIEASSGEQKAFRQALVAAE